MKTDRSIFLLKMALVAILLIIFANQFNTRDTIGLVSVLATIPLVFAVDIIKHVTKRDISHRLELAYLFFILVASIIGSALMVYNLGLVYDKMAHFLSGALTVFVARELFGRSISELPTGLQFLFYVSLAVLVAVAWETYEFSMDQLIGADMQKFKESGVSDTMIDLISATVGALSAQLLLTITRDKKFEKNKIANKQKA